MKAFSWKRTAISLGLGLVVLAIAFTFFNKKSVDDGELEQQLTSKIMQQPQFGNADVSVDCPSSEQLKKGTNFDCAATINGHPQTLHVVLLDDAGNYSVALPKPPGASQKSGAASAN